MKGGDLIDPDQAAELWKDANGTHVEISHTYCSAMLVPVDDLNEAQ
jgi:hypothetical protein